MPANLTSVFDSAFGGALGIDTCSIYRLDPTGTTPIEPVVDLVPGYSPMRVTLDVIDSETMSRNFRVTTHAMQDFADASSNVIKELRVLTVTGVFSAFGPVVMGASNLVTLARLDMMRLNNLALMADRREPVMVTTPRHSLARAFITSLPSSWSNEDGESIPVQLVFLEARIVGPATISAYADVDSLAVGNNAATGGGQGGGEIVNDVDFLNPLELR